MNNNYNSKIAYQIRHGEIEITNKLRQYIDNALIKKYGNHGWNLHHNWRWTSDGSIFLGMAIYYFNKHPKAQNDMIFIGGRTDSDHF